MRILLCLCILTLGAIPARAGSFKISFDHLNWAEGDATPKTLNAYIEAIGEDTPITFFQYEFQVSLVSGSGQMRFSPPSAADLAALAVDPNYVLTGIGSPFVSAPTSNTWPDDTISGGDTAGFSSRILSVGTRALLAIVTLTPGPGTLAPPAGSVFQIDLIPTSLTAQEQGNFDTQSYFAYYDEGRDLDVPVAFDSTPGFVRVTAVPEPSSLALALTASTPLLALALRRRPSPPAP